MDTSKKKFSVNERISTAKRGFEGLGNLMYYEPNVWMDIAAAVIVIIAGIEFGLTATEWVLIIFAIGFVLAVTAVNISLEIIADSNPNSKTSGILKSLFAASILITNITAITIGLIVFIPKIFFTTS